MFYDILVSLDDRALEMSQHLCTQPDGSLT